jgi:phage/plasmid primase-like uncharacterized protein
MIALDYQRINAIALQQIYTLLHQWLPNGKVIGNEFCVGSLAGEASKKKTGGSLRIHIRGDKVGVWSDFATKEGGNDLISLYAAIFTNNKQGEAATLLASQFNITPLVNDTAPIHATAPPRNQATPAAEIQAKFNKLDFDDSHCSYFKTKEVSAPADIRYGKDGLGYYAAVPLFNAQGELVNFERIYNKVIEVAGTNKLSVKGAEKIGVYYPINYTAATVTNNTQLHFCEGLTTGICIALGLNNPATPVIVCSALGNIKHVITHFRSKYPDHQFVIHADNDQWKPEKPNYGLENAQKLADEFNCLISLPPFDPELKDIYAERIPEPTDWNDYYRLNGLDALRDIIINTPQPYKYQYGKSGLDLVSKQFKETEWLVDGIIPQNSLNLLSAKPKDGKSWWSLFVSISIACGGVALGNSKFKCEKGAVLYLSLEDSEAGLHFRVVNLLRTQNMPMPPSFFYEVKADKAGEGFEKQIETWVKQMRTEHADLPLLVIIDTFKMVKQTATNKNAYDNDYESTGTFRRMIEQLDIAILLIHHNNKMKFTSGDDPMDAISGTTGLSGGVDNNLILRRYSNGLAELHRRGRLYTDNTAIVMKFDIVDCSVIEEEQKRFAGIWTALDGDIDMFNMSDARQQIMAAIREGATSLKELSELIDKPWETIQRTVNRMVHDKQIIRRKEARSFKLSLPVIDGNHDDDDDEVETHTF